MAKNRETATSAAPAPVAVPVEAAPAAAPAEAAPAPAGPSVIVQNGTAIAKPKPTIEVKRARLKAWLDAKTKRDAAQAALDAAQVALDDVSVIVLDGDANTAGQGYSEFVLNGVRYTPMKTKSGRPYIRPATTETEVETFTI